MIHGYDTPRPAKGGYALLLAMFAAVSLTFFVFSISSLNRSYRSQVVHTNQQQLSFQIGFSGFQRVVARIWLKPWEDRFFKDAPVAENGQSFLSGEYDSYVENAPGNTSQGDIYMRVKLEGVTRVYVWRVENVPDLLDSAQLRTLFFGELKENEYPAGPGTGYGSKINQILVDRGNNLPKAVQVANTLSTLNDVRDIAQVMGARPPALPAVVSLGLPPPPTNVNSLGAGIPSFNPGGVANPPDFPDGNTAPPSEAVGNGSLVAAVPAPNAPLRPPPGDPMAPAPGEAPPPAAAAAAASDNPATATNEGPATGTESPGPGTGPATETPTIYECGACGMEFPNSQALSAHQPCQPPNGGYPCDNCGQVFSSNSALNAHFQAAHPSVPPGTNYTCSVCGQVFQNNDEYIIHMSGHSAIPVPPPGETPPSGTPGGGSGDTMCWSCNTWFDTPEAMAAHTCGGAGSGGSGGFNCPTCGLSCSSAGLLADHRNIAGH